MQGHIDEITYICDMTIATGIVLVARPCYWERNKSIIRSRNSYKMFSSLHIVIWNSKHKINMKLDDSAFFRTKSYITKICYFEYPPVCPNSCEKLTQIVIRSSLESVRTLLRITRLVHRKSYLVIIWPISYEKLTKSEIRSSSSRFEHCSQQRSYMMQYIWAAPESLV